MKLQTVPNCSILFLVITDDEIRNELSTAIHVICDMRFDAFDDRANYVARYKVTKNKYAAFEALLEKQYINDEAVKIVRK